MATGALDKSWSMANFVAEIDVDVDVAAAHAYLRDPRNRVAWDSSVRSVEPIDGASGEVGDRYDVVVGFYGKAIEATCEIVESTPERIVFTTSGRIQGRDVIEISARDGGARVSMELDVRMKGVARLLDRGLQVAFDGIGENVVAGVRTALAS